MTPEVIVNLDANALLFIKPAADWFENEKFQQYLLEQVQQGRGFEKRRFEKLFYKIEDACLTYSRSLGLAIAIILKEYKKEYPDKEYEADRLIRKITDQIPNL